MMPCQFCGKFTDTRLNQGCLESTRYRDPDGMLGALCRDCHQNEPKQRQITANREATPKSIRTKKPVIENSVNMCDNSQYEPE